MFMALATAEVDMWWQSARRMPGRGARNQTARPGGIGVTAGATAIVPCQLKISFKYFFTFY
jgi:hypothetical protein